MLQIIQQASLNLSIEPLNRFGYLFLNIAEDASDYVELVNRTILDTCMIHFILI